MCSRTFCYFFLLPLLEGIRIYGGREPQTAGQLMTLSAALVLPQLTSLTKYAGSNQLSWVQHGIPPLLPSPPPPPASQPPPPPFSLPSHFPLFRNDPTHTSLAAFIINRTLCLFPSVES